MRHLRRLAIPAYIVAATLILFAVLDVIQAVWPVELGEVTWRVLAVSLLGRLLLTPILGLLLAYGAALLLEQPRVLRTMAVMNAVLACVLVVGLAFYVLDVLQMRAQVQDTSQNNYDLGVFVSFAKYGIGFIVLVALAVSQRRAGGAIARESPRAASDSGALLVFDEPERSPEPQGHDEGEPEAV